MMKERESHGVQLLIRAVVKDPDGKVLSDTGLKPSKSFVLNFLKFFHALFDGVNVGGTDTSGATKTMLARQLGSYYPGFNSQFQLDATVNEHLYGIVLGTNDGASPVDNEDYQLDTQLTEGVGAGNITHGESVVGTVSVVGANVDMVLTRAFTNQTGSSIGAKESGIYKRFAGPPTFQAYVAYFCVVRDVFAEITIPDKCSLTIYYTVRTTV